MLTVSDRVHPVNLGRYVQWDDYSIGQSGELLWTDGVSPCLAITLYDQLNKKGALAHISGFPVVPEYLQPQNIVETLITTLAPYSQLEATLVGESGADKSKSTLVKQKLREFEIPVVGEELGGFQVGRDVFFGSNTGRVTVYRYRTVL